MDKEQRRRMAYRSIIEQRDEEQLHIEVEFTVRVSGDYVELIQSWDAPWENERGEPDEQYDCWVMSKDGLKRLIAAAQWCIEKSEAFEASHPIPEPEPQATPRQRFKAAAQLREQGLNVKLVGNQDGGAE